MELTARTSMPEPIAFDITLSVDDLPEGKSLRDIMDEQIRGNIDGTILTFYRMVDKVCRQGGSSMLTYSEIPNISQSCKWIVMFTSDGQRDEFLMNPSVKPE